MTREEFFSDVAEALRLLGQLGCPAAEVEAPGKIETMKAGGTGVTPDDFRRYANAIDWARQDDPRVLADLAKVLLRLVAGLGAELAAFRRARE